MVLSVAAEILIHLVDIFYFLGGGPKKIVRGKLLICGQPLSSNGMCAPEEGNTNYIWIRVLKAESCLCVATLAIRWCCCSASSN